MSSFIEDFAIIIHPQCEIEDVVLDESSLHKCTTTNSGALVFTGEIDIKLYEAILCLVVRQCPWLVCELVVNESGQVLVSSKKQDDPHPSPYFSGFLRCEIDDRSNLDFHPSLPQLFPMLVPENMLRTDLALHEVDGIPICALRISQFMRHFVLSYRMNAMYYDQQSVVYFFTYISHLYMNNGRAKMVSPMFLPYAHLLQGKFLSQERSPILTRVSSTSTESLTSSNKEDNPHHHHHHPNNMSLNHIRSVGLAHKFSVIVNEEKVAEWKLQSREIAISTNDLLHAILIQANAKFQNMKKPCSDYVNIKFARNMRPLLNVGVEVLGDYVKYEVWQMTTSQVTEMSLLDLAIANRQYISGFFDVHDNSNESSLLTPSHSGKSNQSKQNIVDLNTVVIRNFWSHFPYDEITFRQSKIQALLLEDTKRMTTDDNICANVCVSFRTSVENHSNVYMYGGSNPYYNESMSRRDLVIDVYSLFPSLLENLRVITEESGLFRYY